MLTVLEWWMQSLVISDSVLPQNIAFLVLFRWLGGIIYLYIWLLAYSGLPLFYNPLFQAHPLLN